MHSRTTPHISPYISPPFTSYGVSFVRSSNKNYHDISRALGIGQYISSLYNVCGVILVIKKAIPSILFVFVQSPWSNMHSTQVLPTMLLVSLSKANIQWVQNFLRSNDSFSQRTISIRVSKDWRLTHWCRVTHICIGYLTITGSDNDLSPVRRQASMCYRKKRQYRWQWFFEFQDFWAIRHKFEIIISQKSAICCQRNKHDVNPSVAPFTDMV